MYDADSLLYPCDSKMSSILLLNRKMVPQANPTQIDSAMTMGSVARYTSDESTHDVSDTIDSRSREEHTEWLGCGEGDRPQNRLPANRRRIVSLDTELPRLLLSCFLANDEIPQHSRTCRDSLNLWPHKLSPHVSTAAAITDSHPKAICNAAYRKSLCQRPALPLAPQRRWPRTY